MDPSTVRASKYFDPEWYTREYADVRKIGMDPADHYAFIGWRLGRKPSRDHSASAFANGKAAQSPTIISDAADTRTAPSRVGEKRVDQVPQAIPMGAAAHDRGGSAMRPPVPDFLIPTWSGDVDIDAPRATHFGSAIDSMVQSAWARVAPDGGSQVYDTVKRYFDMTHYLLKYPDIAAAKKLDPIQHYIDNGAKEGRNPTPYFSTSHYVNRYQDVRMSGENPFYHWLTKGAREGRVAAPFAKFDELSEMLGMAPSEVEANLITKRQDLRRRFEHGVLGEMVNKAAELEPLIAHSWKEAISAKLPPFHSDQVVSQTVAIHAMQKDANFRRAKAVVVIPHCRMSGATKIAGFLTSALTALYGSDDVLVVSSDLDILQFPDWFPAGVRMVSLPRYAEGLPQVLREKLLVEFIRSLDAQHVFNVNSALFWHAFKSFGKALRATTEVYAYFFCNDKSQYGFWAGYPLSKFYRHFDALSGVITDSHFLADEFKQRYLVPEAQAHKIATLETPIVDIPEMIIRDPGKPSKRPQIFWAGRFDRQKRIDIVFEIARAMPDCDFLLWGEPVLDKGNQALTPPENVHLQGVYTDISHLPLQHCEAWLYTSEWDGVPNMLIEIAALGIPLVGSLVGGTGEVLKSKLSVPVAEIENIADYVNGIRSILAAPDDARVRASTLRDTIVGQRTEASYRETLDTFLSATATVTERA